MNAEPSQAWVGFFTEAARLSKLANERLIAALPIVKIEADGTMTLTRGNVSVPVNEN